MISASVEARGESHDNKEQVAQGRGRRPAQGRIAVRRSGRHAGRLPDAERGPDLRHGRKVQPLRRASRERPAPGPYHHLSLAHRAVRCPVGTSARRLRRSTTWPATRRRSRPATSMSGKSRRRSAPCPTGKDDRTVLILGAGAGGLNAALALRRNGFAGRVMMATAEADLPYDRPSLSKGFMAGDTARAELVLEPEPVYLAARHRDPQGTPGDRRRQAKEDGLVFQSTEAPLRQASPGHRRDAEDARDQGNPAAGLLRFEEPSRRRRPSSPRSPGPKPWPSSAAASWGSRSPRRSARGASTSM